MAVILASSSLIRRAMLAQAGVEHEAIAADVSEEALKAELAGAEPAEIASRLAAAKALAVSGAHLGAWTIGSDSLVTVDGRLFSKPADRDEAAAHLRAFSGQAMELTSAVAIAWGGKIDWTFADCVRLHVRELSEEFIAHYLDLEWPEVGYCVGVFRLEGRGVTLFNSIDGDYFTVLGMPLLPLLKALRERGAIET